MAIDQLGMNARAYGRILKIARTIADMAQSAAVQSDHVSEAIQSATWTGSFSEEGLPG